MSAIALGLIRFFGSMINDIFLFELDCDLVLQLTLSALHVVFFFCLSQCAFELELPLVLSTARHLLPLVIV